MIKGNIISLRAIEKSDSENYYKWINDDETNQWRGLYLPSSKKAASKWIKDKRKEHAEELSLSIETIKGEHIGFIGLQGISNRSQRAEIWIYIGSKKHWSKGFGKDSIKTLCAYAFNQMNLHRIWLECNPEYKNVVKCYKDIGFEMEGKLREAYYRHGKFRDTCIMGLLKSDFIKLEGRKK